jgi:hypothetical protein
MGKSVDFIRGADLVDTISITDNVLSQLVNLTNLPALEVWYYTRLETTIKFSKETNKVGYKSFTIVSPTNYRAYLEGVDTILFETGLLYADIYIAVTNADLVKGKFVNYGTVDLGINIIDKPISLRK